MKKDSQYYSKIAKKYIQDMIAKGEVHHNMVTYGDLNLMEDLFILFGGNNEYYKTHNLSWGEWHRYRFQFVMNKLDKESKKPDAIFRKSYICYNGIINRPTRCFIIKE